MKALLISFSVRRTPGNCENALNFVRQYLQKKGVEPSLLALKDLEIIPCSGCDYDCCEPGGICPITDDVMFIYDQILQSDLIIFAVPTYRAAPPARYFAWRERFLSYFTTKDQYDRYLEIPKGFIVFGKEDFGGLETVNWLQRGIEKSSEFVLIQNDQYNQSSLEGKLFEVPEVQGKLVDLTDELLNQI